MKSRTAARSAALAGVGGFIVIFLLAELSQMSGAALLIAPFGASCVLVFGLPASPLAQPRKRHRRPPGLERRRACSLLGLRRDALRLRARRGARDRRHAPDPHHPSACGRRSDRRDPRGSLVAVPDDAGARRRGRDRARRRRLSSGRDRRGLSRSELMGRTRVRLALAGDCGFGAARSKRIKRRRHTIVVEAAAQAASPRFASSLSGLAPD